MKEVFNVQGMSCSACVRAVERAVEKLEGVDQVAVNLLSNSMQVEYDDQVTSSKAIIKAVQKAGYKAKSQKQAGQAEVKAGGQVDLTDEMDAAEKAHKFRVIASFCFMVPLMYIAMGPMVGLPSPGVFQGAANSVIFAFSQMLLTLPVIYLNRNYYINGFKALFRGQPNMDSLVAIGSSAAFVYGIFVIYILAYATGHGLSDLVQLHQHSLYFESAAMILTLISLGKYLEAKSKGKTTSAIKKLMDLTPKRALVLVDGQEKEVPIEEVKVGDILLVKPGSAVPVDGSILSGRGSFDESAITGESIPSEKAEGETIIGGSLLQVGSITMVADKVGEDTTMAKIIRLVQDANATKAPIAKLADKIAGIFVPAVIAIALVTGGVWLVAGYSFEFALSRAISVLIISCPCALGLATPVAIMVGTGKGASQGILIKSAEALEGLQEISAVILDKTGTVTEGKPLVTDLIPAKPGLGEKGLLALAASLEAPSEHPLSLAILAAAEEKNLTYEPVSDFLNSLGKGISGSLEGEKYYAGNSLYMAELGIDLGDFGDRAVQLADQGKTALYFADSRELLGLVAVADPIKDSSAEAVRLLEEGGSRVYLLTGDNQRTAQAIASQLGIQQVMAEVMPDQKEAKVREIQASGKKVAMVGDGINDAPALARANVGIAIGAGTDIAIEAADIVLLKSDLLDVENSIFLSRHTVRNIKQNLFWAFFYNSLCIPLAAGVFYPAFGLLLNPMIASAAMSMSSLFVVSNALRLNRLKFPAKAKKS